MNENSSERRRHRRLPVANGAYVSLDASARKLWHILDVSPGGLAFRYMQGEKTTVDPSELEIVTRDTSFFLENIPFRVVSDREVKPEPGDCFKLRRCGVEFMPLTAAQTSRLEFFMGRYCGASA
jgi:hypothetical protein